MLNIVDAESWLDDLSRRVQHYGYRYDYRERIVRAEMYLGSLPAWAAEIADNLHHMGLFDRSPDQVIVNEYNPGQGIGAHVDCEPCFGSTISSITLGSGCSMDLTHIERRVTHSIYLEPRSLLILAGESRYNWRHAIPGRVSDTLDGVAIPRERRVSLTFRTVTIRET